MKQKSLLILGAITVVAIGGATLNKRDSGKTQASSTERGALFPELKSQINEVTRISMRQGEDELSIEREGSNWVLAKRGGYPAKFETAKATLLQLAEFEVTEIKTANPAYFDKLGVEAPGPDNQAREFTLYNSDGESLAAVIIGNTPRGSREAAFVRRNGEDQVYQIKGRVTATSRLNDWAVRDIIKLAKDRVDEVTIEHADGERVAVAPDPLDLAGKAMLLDVPDGRELSFPTAADSLLGGLSSLQFDDVGLATTLPFAEEGATRTRYTCKDGLVLNLSLCEEAETWWVNLTASFDESRVDVSMPPQGEEELSPEEQQEAQAQHSALVQAQIEKGQAEAADLNQQHEKWAYALPTYRAQNLVKRMEDLLKPLPDPANTEDGPPLDAGSQLSQDELQDLLREAGINPEDLMQTDGATSDG